MSFNKITTSDLTNKGVSGLPDTPGLSTSEMQRKFDEILKIEVLFESSFVWTKIPEVCSVNSYFQRF